MSNRIRTTKSWLVNRSEKGRNVGSGTKHKSYKFSCGGSTKGVCTGSFSPLIGKGEYVHGSYDAALRCIKHAKMHKVQ